MIHFYAILASVNIDKVVFLGIKDPETEEEYAENVTCELTWQDYVAARDVYLRERGLRLIRRYRDKLLVESDWIETPYSQSTIANLEEWNAYRDYLRDLPLHVDKLKWVGGMPDFTSLNIPPLPKTIRKTLQNQ